ncbi:hypothetical protein B0H14DRAFT_3177557 [Mycena olivaceomarginata]|nr:hypothetical protein B0H14DRAFT_3177557 [Mycena olivaceomarginata]
MGAAYGGGSLLQASFHGAGNGWSSSSLTIPAWSQTSSLSLDAGSLAGVDDMSSMSSPLGGRFSDFSGSGFSNGSFGSSATSDEALHRVNSLSQQVVALENTVHMLSDPPPLPPPPRPPLVDNLPPPALPVDNSPPPALPVDNLPPPAPPVNNSPPPVDNSPPPVDDSSPPEPETQKDSEPTDLFPQKKASASPPSPEDIRKHIVTVMGTSAAV